MLLEIKDVKKEFGGVGVLHNINLNLEKGQILGLIGENGAGKSTLMNIVSGQFPPSAGELFLEGVAFAPSSPKVAIESGIAFIHQELNLFPNLSVSDNLFIHRFPRKKIAAIPVIDRKKCRELAAYQLARVGLNFSPDTLVEKLTTAQRQMVEITKALISQPRLIIFDEPTTSLTTHETEKLFELMGQLKAAGTAMIYISHNLDEVGRISDKIVVMRDGRVVKTTDQVQEFDVKELIDAMVGREFTKMFEQRKIIVTGEEVLRVENLRAGKKVRDVSFQVKKGEVLGLYGLVGAGRSETARLIFGLDKKEGGEIFWRGARLEDLSPDAWLKAGAGFLTEDRREEGLLLQQGILQNIRLAALRRFTTKALGTLDFKAAEREAGAIARATQLKFNSLSEQPVATLSGGNRQKVVLAKWLLTNPQLLILDEPTKGIDIGAKQEIYTLINELVGQGASVLLISSEVEELMGLCDRIVVLSQGKTIREFSKRPFNRAELLSAALHQSIL